MSRNSDGVRVSLDSGEVIEARLVVAADGRNSSLRAQAGIPVTRLVYGQSAVVCAVAHEKPHHGVALEHFLPGGPFAQLPMSGNEQHEHLSAIVFTERHEIVKRLGSAR